MQPGPELVEAVLGNISTAVSTLVEGGATRQVNSRRPLSETSRNAPTSQHRACDMQAHTLTGRVDKSGTHGFSMHGHRLAQLSSKRPLRCNGC